MSKTCIVNVGVNTRHRPLRSPRFRDGTFEFVTFPEKHIDPQHCPRAIKYKDLVTVTGTPPEVFIPQGYLSRATHNDPEFKTFTYGDDPEEYPRAANLARLSKGDRILFYARLVDWEDGYTARAGFYFIGHFVIENVYPNIRTRPQPSVLRKIRNNAHVLRGECNPRCYNGFWVFKGSRESRRYDIAVPFDRKLIEACRIRDADGRRIKWKPHATELEVIASYFRTAKLITDEAVLDRLWSRIEAINP